MDWGREFSKVFGRPPSAEGDAPGRVNLMGEHTDYNDGHVLPIPIPQRAYVAVAPREDRSVRVYSADVEREVRSYTLGEETAGAGWTDYVQGVTRELQMQDYPMKGFDAYVHSEVPIGAGVSSSAALEVALLRALRSALKLELSDRELAEIGHGAEVNFVGVPVGLMDQMVSSLGHEGHVLYIDTQSLVTREFPLPDSMELVVIDSGIRRALGSGAYRQRRAECVRAATSLGVNTLRELDLGDLPRVAKLEPPLDRRTRHVITENARVLDLVKALEERDEAAIGELFAASHASLRDDFDISLPAIDRLVEIAQEEPAILGARLTGGGFGGSVVMLARRGEGARAARAISERYAREADGRPRILLPLRLALV